MNLIERHFTYTPGPVTLAANATSPNLQIVIASDAPFVLRSIGGNNFASLALFSMKFADASGRYRMNVGRNMFQTSLLGGLFAPIYPQIVYPPTSNLEFVLSNFNNSQRTMTPYFRGITLHRPGTVYAPDFPPKFELLPFAYPLEVAIVEGAATVLLPDQNLFIKNDADFLFTDAQVTADISRGVGGYTDLRVKIKDRLGKYYSNDFIDINSYLGSNAGIAEEPSILYPGIYLQRNDYLAFDFQLNDTGSPGQTLFFEVLCKGFKVFPR